MKLVTPPYPEVPAPGKDRLGNELEGEGRRDQYGTLSPHVPNRWQRQSENMLSVGAAEGNRTLVVSLGRAYMIHHLSIAARDPRHAASVLAELMGGKSVPFPPNPGSFF